MYMYLYYGGILALQRRFYGGGKLLHIATIFFLDLLFCFPFCYFISGVYMTEVKIDLGDVVLLTLLCTHCIFEYCNFCG